MIKVPLHKRVERWVNYHKVITRKYPQRILLHKTDFEVAVSKSNPLALKDFLYVLPNGNGVPINCL